MQQAIQQTGTANTYEGTQRVIPQTGAASIYERFLEMPIPVVLTAMWPAGTTLLGVGVLTLYLLVATAVGGAKAPATSSTSPNTPSTHSGE